MYQSKPKSNRSSNQENRKADRHARSSRIPADSLDDESFLPENASIEADGEFDDTEHDFSALASEIIDSLEYSTFEIDGSFEAEHGEKLHAIDEVRNDRENAEQSVAQKKRFVIPKLKRPETQDQSDTNYNSDEGKREWRKLERDPDVGNRNKNLVDRGWDQDRSKDRGDRDGGWNRDRTDRDRIRSRDQGDRDQDRFREQGDRDQSRNRDQGDRNRKDRQENRGIRDKHFPENEKESTNGRRQLNDEHSVHREERQSLFDSFAADGLISAERPLDIKICRPLEQVATKESGLAVQMTAPMNVHVVKQKEEEEIEPKPAPAKSEEEGQLEIPMGRDSLVFVRDYYPWQVRVHPVSKKDMPRADFTQVWAMADSSSIVWSDHTNFGGVAEFLLKDDDSIQKFMRKVLWHNYEADCITVEITQRKVSNKALGHDNGAESELDCVLSQAVFRFHNTHARQLLKTYYPTPKGEVTERSLYVNNVGTGVSADLMKAIFPCALKISVAKPGKGATSTALVETESEEASVNYLVVYHQVRINNLDLVLSTLHYDWEAAKEKFMTPEKNVNANTTRTAASLALKRPNTSSVDSSIPRKVSTTSPIAARGREVRGSQVGSQRGRGRGSVPARGRGSRGGTASRGHDYRRPLLPNPVIGGGGSEGLLPLPEQHHLPPPPSAPLLALPTKPVPHGPREADYLNQETDRVTAELQEIHKQLESQVLETRASLMQAARMADMSATETNMGELVTRLDYSHRPEIAARSHRPVDNEGEHLRDPPRRALLPLDGPPRMEHKMRDEPPSHRRSRPPPEQEPVPPRGRGRTFREEEDDDDQRSSSHQRRYLLEAPPPEKEPYAGAAVYDYDHSSSRSRIEPDIHPDERPPLLRHAPAERNRPAYPEERRLSRDHEAYNYEDQEFRRSTGYAQNQGGYKEAVRPRGHAVPRYRENYNRHY